MERKRVLIIEPETSGHHGPYLEWMVLGLIEHGFDVSVITLVESLSHPSMQLLSRKKNNDYVEESLHIIPVAGPSVLPRGGLGSASLFARELSYWRQFKAWFQNCRETIRPDVVLLPCLDHCLYAIGLLGSPFTNCPWVGLSMRPSFHYREMGIIAPRPSFATVKRKLFFRMLSNIHLRCFLTIDEPLNQYLISSEKNVGSVVFLPEPVTLKKIADTKKSKEYLGIPENRKLILLYGDITHRKGVAELLDAVAHPSFPPSVDVLLAGKVSLEIERLLALPWVRNLVANGRVRVHDRFFENYEEPCLFSAADLVWLGYRGHYASSGVLVQAARAGRLVLGCEEGIIGWQVNRHGLGSVIQPGNTASVVMAIKALLPRVDSVDIVDDDPTIRIGGTHETAKTILAHAIVGACQR